MSDLIGGVNSPKIIVENFLFLALRGARRDEDREAMYQSFLHFCHSAPIGREIIKCLLGKIMWAISGKALPYLQLMHQRFQWKFQYLH